MLGVGRHVGGHRANVADDPLLILLNIGLGDAVGIAQHRFCTVGKPELHPELEQQQCESHHQQRRHRRNGGKQRDQPDMHAGTCPALPPVGQQDCQSPGDEDSECHQRDEVGNDQQGDGCRRKAVGRGPLPGQHPVADQAEQDRGDRETNLQPRIEVRARHPAHNAAAGPAGGVSRRHIGTAIMQPLPR